MSNKQIYLEYVGTTGVHQVIAVGFKELVGSPGAGLIIFTLFLRSPSLGSKISRTNTKYKVQSNPKILLTYKYVILNIFFIYSAAVLTILSSSF